MFSRGIEDNPGRWRGVRRGERVAAGLAVLTLAFNGFHLYQIKVASTRLPRFARGGTFHRPAALPALPAPTPASGGAVATPSPAPGARPSRERVASVRGPAETGPGGGSPASPGGGFPAPGLYLYRVTGPEGRGPGTESSPFGTREYPERLAVTASRGGRLGPDEVVLDLHFDYPQGSGNAHEEREVVAYRPDGLVFTFESGTIAFSGFSQTSQGCYDPPMLQVPLPLVPGATRSGISRALDPCGGTTASRTEAWTVRTLGTETLVVLGQPAATWVVEVHRETVGGGPTSEQVRYRDRRYWYDPGRGLWVRWREDFQGQRFAFSYETHYLATLAAFHPS